MTTARRQRALVVAFCFPPHAAIGTHRTLRLVSQLVAEGWDVDVLSVRPDDYLNGTPVDDKLLAAVPPAARVVRSGALRGFSALGRWIQPLRGPRRPPATGSTTAPASRAAAGSTGSSPGLKTLIEELVALPDKDVGWLLPAVVTGMRSFASNRPDVIFSSAPPWTTHLVAGILAATLSRPWVADFRDPWVRSPWTRYRTRTVSSLAARLEAWVIRRAGAVLFTTNAAREEFASYYGDDVARRLHTVYNGCEASEFPAREAQRGADRYVLLHAGSLYGGRSPVPLLTALSMVRQRQPELAARLQLQFLGSTSFPGVDLEQTCHQLGIADQVQFLPRVDRGRSLAAMQDASALVLLQSGTAMAIPGKLYEYLAAGRPVLALCEPGEMADFIRTHRLGLVADANDAGRIADALQTLMGAKAEFQVPAPPWLYDGRLRATEMARVLAGVTGSASNERLAVTEDTGRPHA